MCVHVRVCVRVSLDAGVLVKGNVVGAAVGAQSASKTLIIADRKWFK